jgi:hypothetical protein
MRRKDLALPVCFAALLPAATLHPGMAQTLPPPAAPAAPPATPGYHAYMGRKAKVGQTETVQIHVKEVSRSVTGPAADPFDVQAELHEIQAVYQDRVTKVDAKGNATEYRISVRSASGRAAGKEAMRTLTTAHASLVVSLAPEVRVRRASGGALSAREAELWGLVFSPVGPDDTPDGSDMDIPDSLHVGDSFDTVPPSQGAIADGVGLDPATKAKTVVTGTTQIGGSTYLILKTHLAAPLDMSKLGDKDTKFTDARMGIAVDQTVPTKADRPIQHETDLFTFTMKGSASSEGVTVPISLSENLSQETTVLASADAP